VGQRSIGFGSEQSGARNKQNAKILHELTAQDLLRYGLIPEFVGRMPILVTLDCLDEDDITRVLTEPKNAFVKQYQKFFSLDDVELVFEEGALRAIARKAMAMGTGARGLKSILESVLLNSMFEVPSHPEVKRCVITERSIVEATEPDLFREEELRAASA
ncbi:MAG: ATP-dependent Clp protease ATP-binding subunit ClpX, partial [Candidatus Dormibacteria bacterium]